MLKIISVPNDILSSPTQPVDKIDERIKQLVYGMENALLAQKDPKGVGLAANQVGENLSLFIIKPSEKSQVKVFINPKIVKTLNPSTSVKNPTKRRKQPVKLEGCLSIPRIWGPVKRAKKILLEYQDFHTEAVKRRWFQGFEATIIQHEVDHLKGVVFTQRSMEQGEKLYKEVGDELKPIEI
ncbi:peptide deformylase [Patescibacteria group bacterium]|nr:peptide deformylase [Patescibacteria group bacterium]